MSKNLPFLVPRVAKLWFRGPTLNSQILACAACQKLSDLSRPAFGYFVGLSRYLTLPSVTDEYASLRGVLRVKI